MPAPRRARTRLACGLAATAVAAVLALAPLATVEGAVRDVLAWLAGFALVLAAAAALRAVVDERAEVATRQAALVDRVRASVAAIPDVEVVGG
ncbi:MAG TPA: hypothetical protein VFJ69_16400, partial [Actinomycetota bacterium]|nr:hypothetical protein [Actinomycetota bacterium]